MRSRTDGSLGVQCVGFAVQAPVCLPPGKMQSCARVCALTRHGVRNWCDNLYVCVAVPDCLQDVAALLKDLHMWDSAANRSKAANVVQLLQAGWQPPLPPSPYGPLMSRRTRSCTVTIVSASDTPRTSHTIPQVS